MLPVRAKPRIDLRPPQRRAKSRASRGCALHAACGRCDEGAVGEADWGREFNPSLFEKRRFIGISPSVMARSAMTPPSSEGGFGACVIAARAP